MPLAQYMSDDYAYGHGIGTTDIDAYFATRDFTINEVIVVDGMIISTEQADEDLRERTVRACEYELENGCIGPKLKTKAKLLAAVYDVMYGRGHDETPPSWDEPRDFYWALALNKAFQYGTEFTERFMERLGYHNDGNLYHQAIELAVELANGDGNFEFRGSAIADQIMQYVGAPERNDFPSDRLDDSLEHAVAIMRRYRGNLPQGAKGEY